MNCIELINKVMVDTMYREEDKLDILLELVTGLSEWQSMDSAPKDRAILVDNVPIGDEFGFTSEAEGPMVVEWVEDDEGWMIFGTEFDVDSNYPRASNPVAWMEVPVRMGGGKW